MFLVHRPRLLKEAQAVLGKRTIRVLTDIVGLYFSKKKKKNDEVYK